MIMIRRRMMDIIAQACEMRVAVETFISHARKYFYEVMLSGYSCPDCKVALIMTADGNCRCTGCGNEFDPTIAFQRCGSCGGKVRLKICRYQCVSCSEIVHSRFVFDGNVFDKEYFKQRMQQSREKRNQQRELIIEELIENRSDPLEADYIDFSAVEGLEGAIDELTLLPQLAGFIPLCKGFDLKCYQNHLEANIGPFEVCFDDIPQLEEDARLDRIWRFVAVIFMEHLGTMELYQEDEVIYIKRENEAD
jgi:hypothetical protein